MIDAIKKLVVVLAILLGATAAAANAKPAPKPALRAAAKDWTATIAVTPTGSALRGNPAAKVKLIEYISYTCPHCAEFDAEGSPAIVASHVKSGKVRVEMRPMFRNALDVPAALLAHCGPAEKFFGNHSAILQDQKQWLEVASHPSEAQIARWSNPDFGARMQAVAEDLGLIKLMLARGYTPQQLNACLANRPLAEAMNKQSSDGINVYRVPGTPSFLINNKLQANVFDWKSLRPLLDRAVAH